MTDELQEALATVREHGFPAVPEVVAAVVTARRHSAQLTADVLATLPSLDPPVCDLEIQHEVEGTLFTYGLEATAEHVVTAIVRARRAARDKQRLEALRDLGVAPYQFYRRRDTVAFEWLAAADPSKVDEAFIEDLNDRAGEAVYRVFIG